MTGSVQITRSGLLDIFAHPPVTRDDSPETDDISLAAQAIRNREAFAELYRRHANSVYRYMLAHVGNVQDAQDLTAQTFLASLEGLDRFEGRGTFVAWLFSIAHRKAMDYFRSAHDNVPLEYLSEMPHPDQQPDQQIEDQFDYERLSAAIRSLAPDRAEAITLRVFAGLSTAEIAVTMGRRESAVRMLLSRAVQDLKRMLVPSRSSLEQVSSG